jgi:predicted MFS family arabinose efflux permease
MCGARMQGGFVMQSVIVKWFEDKHGMDPDELGLMLGACNIVSALSALAVPRVVAAVGPVKTMAYTHIPSNLLLIVVAFMPTKVSALAVLYLRFCLSQMDVPARQAFVALVVSNDDRSAAGGITNLARSVGVSIAPFFLGPMLDQGPRSKWYLVPFILAGVLKTVYDVSLLAVFGSLKTRSEG